MVNFLSCEHFEFLRARRKAQAWIIPLEIWCSKFTGLTLARIILFYPFPLICNFLQFSYNSAVLTLHLLNQWGMWEEVGLWTSFFTQLSWGPYSRGQVTSFKGTWETMLKSAFFFFSFFPLLNPGFCDLFFSVGASVLVELKNFFIRSSSASILISRAPTFSSVKKTSALLLGSKPPCPHLFSLPALCWGTGWHHLLWQ